MDYWHKRYTCPYFTSSEKRRGWHYAACAVQFGEKREDCDTLWGYHLEIPAELVTQALTDYTVQVALDKERGVYVIGAMKKE